MSPYTTLAVRPKVITGPAMVNIFAAVPRMKPSAAVNEGPNFSCRTEGSGRGKSGNLSSYGPSDSK